MSLFKKIQADQLAARKAKRKYTTTLLTTLIGELMTDAVGKANGAVVISDSTVVAKVKKFTKSLKEVHAAYVAMDSGKAALAELELDILAAYLPKQLTDEELTVILKECGATLVSSAMGFLKENYAGLYDGRAASTIAKSLF